MILSCLLLFVHSTATTSLHHHARSSNNDAQSCPPANSSVIDVSRFSSTMDVRRITSRVCQGGLRLPGSPGHLKAVNYIRQELASIPGLEIEESEFQLANWQPAGDSMYTSAHLQVENATIDVVSAIAYSLPTNGSALSGRFHRQNTCDVVSLTSFPSQGNCCI